VNGNINSEWVQHEFEQVAGEITVRSRPRSIVAGLGADLFYTHQDSMVEIGGDGVLVGLHGNGADPASAIDDLLSQLTSIPDDRHLLVGGPCGGRYVWDRADWRKGCWILRPLKED
jgi:hypothetical protein